MKRLLRRFGLLLALAFALALGQQAGLLHGLAHASERIAQKQDSRPAAPACDQCGLCAQLHGAAPQGLPDLPRLEAADDAAAYAPHAVTASTVVVFRSRAPPVLS